MSDADATTTLRSVPSLVRGHGRAVAAAVAAAAAAGAAVAGARRRRSFRLALPEVGPVAAETAISVHNAAKGSVIATAREADRPDRAMIHATIREAIIESSSSGADVLAAAIGAVEGAHEVADLIGEEPRQMVAGAAAAAVEAAALQGRTAADRVRNVLGEHVPAPEG